MKSANRSRPDRNNLLERVKQNLILPEVAKKGAERSIESEDNVKNSQGA